MEWFKNWLNFNKKEKISEEPNKKYVITITANNAEVLAHVNIYKDKIEEIVLRMLEDNSNCTTDISNEIFMRLQIKHLISVSKKGRNIEVNFMGEAKDNKPYTVNITSNDPKIEKAMLARKEEITQITLELLEKKTIGSDFSCRLILKLDIPYTIAASFDNKQKIVNLFFI